MLNISELRLSTRIPLVTGQPIIGKNRINVSKGVIYLN
jgi:hypothetical protein